MVEHPSNGAGTARFGPFEANFRTRELRNNSKRIRITGQSFEVLQLLLERQGELVTREELRVRLWPSDTFVDYEHSLNATVNRLREALGDSAEKPRWVETLPRRGYRFIGEIEPSVQAARVSAPASVPEAGVKVEVKVAPAPMPRRFSAVWILGISAVAAAAILGVFLRVRPKPGPAALDPIPFTTLPGEETAPAFSPDGSRIAFAWNGDPASGGKGFDLYVKAIGSETLLRLTQHPSEWLSAAWSPDGTRIAFHRIAGPDTGLYLVPALGGPEQKLRATHVPYSVAAPISWSPDGKSIAYDDAATDNSGDRMFLLSLETLEITPVQHNPACAHEGNPTFSTRGQFFYLCVHNVSDFEVFSLESLTASPKRVAGFRDFPHGLAWSADATRLVISEWADKDSELVDTPLSGKAARSLVGPRNATWPALSAKGDKLAYSASFDSSNIWRKDLLHPELPAVKFISSTREQASPQYSPDGKHIAFNSDRGGSWNIWMTDSDGSNLVQISNLKPGTDGPNWSPDGTKIAFDLKQKGHLSVYVADIYDRTPRKLLTSFAEISSLAWSRDSKWIYIRSYESAGRKIFRCPATGGDVDTLAHLPEAASMLESVDGESLYFTVREVNTPLRKASLSAPFAESAVDGLPILAECWKWTVAQNGIYFVPQDAPRALYYYDFATKKSRQVFTIDKDFGDGGFSVSPDGHYLLYSQVDEQNSDIMLVEHLN